MHRMFNDPDSSWMQINAKILGRKCFTDLWISLAFRIQKGYKMNLPPPVKNLLYHRPLFSLMRMSISHQFTNPEQTLCFIYPCAVTFWIKLAHTHADQELLTLLFASSYNSGTSCYGDPHFCWHKQPLRQQRELNYGESKPFRMELLDGYLVFWLEQIRICWHLPMHTQEKWR